MFQNFLQGHPPRFRPRWRWKVTLIFRGEKIKISKWVIYHRFNWSRDFCIYLQIWNRMSRNWDIAICGFWSIIELGLSVTIGRNKNLKMGFFLMISSWIIESKTSDGFKFRWVKLILLIIESLPYISMRVGEESLEDNLRIKSVWNDLKAKIWILICFGLEYQVSSRSDQVRCRNWNASNVCQTMNFTCKNEVLIRNSQIWCMNAQVEIFISNHD